VKDDGKIVIIGNGPSGNEAAATIRIFNKSVPISMFSEEEYPEYCNCFLSDFISGRVSRHQLMLKRKIDYMREGIKLYLIKCIDKIDFEKKYVIYKGGAEKYDKLIIATGTEAIVPKLEGTDLKGVYTLKTLRDAERIKKGCSRSVVIVGAGPVGVELSCALKQNNIKVYLVEKEDWILSRMFSKRIAEILEERMRSNRVEIITQNEVTKIIGKREVEGVELKGNNRIQCNMVIFAVGMKPKTSFLQHNKLNLGKLAGIIVDSRMATNISDVYACGDCIEWRDSLLNRNVTGALWPNAIIGGRTAGSNAIGIERRVTSWLNVYCLQLFGMTATSVGYSDLFLKGLEGNAYVEGKMLGNEYRITLHNGNIIGMQVLGSEENVIPLYNMVSRQDKYSTLQKGFMSNQVVGGNALCSLLLTTRNFVSVGSRG